MTYRQKVHYRDAGHDRALCGEGHLVLLTMLADHVTCRKCLRIMGRSQ